MSQFKKIFSFELKGYFTNKIFIGVTVLLIMIIGVVTCIPRFTSGDNDEGDSGTSGSKESVMYISIEDDDAETFLLESFTEVFGGYDVKNTDESLDDIKKKIVAGEVECAFVFDDITSYKYYVNNKAMSDTNMATANELIQSVYQLSEMVKAGMTSEQAQGIMNAQIKSESVSLGKDQVSNFFYTYIMIFALYFVMLFYGQMISTSVASEKSSRAMELLITSAKPVNMMFGKVMAACTAGFTQLIVVFGSAYGFYNINKDYMKDMDVVNMMFDIPLSLLVYMLVFFVLGFLLYAMIYGAVGSTVSKTEDLNTASMPVTLLFVVAFMIVMMSMTSSVDTTLMKVSSFIPFTAPMAMFTRIAMSSVPFYEIMISIVILIVSVGLIGVVSARIYRVGVLMYGSALKFGAILKLAKKQ